MATTTITWTPNLAPFDKDPDDIVDYVFDLEDWLGVGDEVDAVGTTALADGCTASIYATTTTTATLRVSGGTSGETATATLRVVTANGRQSDRSLRFRIRSL